MKFNPEYTLNIFTDESFDQSIAQVEDRLARCGVSGFFKSFDGKDLFYEYFLTEGSNGAIVIVHGLSEYTKKYYELIYYFLNNGYDVFVYDQRSHGLSFRMAEDITLLHVDSFYHYAADLDLFIKNVVQKATDNPLYIFSHSMGGAVTALYLSSYANSIKRAVLSSPLIEPELNGVPAWLARNGTGVARFFKGTTARYRYAKDFDPDATYKESSHNSRKRYDYIMSQRRGEPGYQTTPLSNGWVHSALKMRPKFMKPRFLKSLATPLLLITATNDTVVNTVFHKPFAAGCPNCTLKTIDAGHNIFSGNDQTVLEYVSSVLEFYGQ